MKKVAVVTSTRAEYGLLRPVIQELRAAESETFRLELVVTGTHLSEQYGMTVQEIINDGMRIDHQISIPVVSDTAVDISNNQAKTLQTFAVLFEEEKYSSVILLGDRYEMLAIAIAAVNTRTPIYHMCGGDVTEGAIDDCIRHSISKMSYLHFTTNDESRRRVIQLGEDPERVFNYGSTSIDNVLRVADMSMQEAMESVGITNEKYAVCTYHPVTLEGDDTDALINEFIDTIKAFPEIDFIVTKSNADQGGARINALLDEAAAKVDNMHVFTSLGVRRYLSLMKYAQFVLGNSSSGIIETPAFHIPTVNIGDRQRGRLQAGSIINCGPDKEAIILAIEHALDDGFRNACMNLTSPYGDGHTAERISKKVIEYLDKEIDLKKKFYNLEVKV